MFQKDGVEPFIGIIISPNFHQPLMDQSTFQFLYVTEQLDPTGQFNMPRGIDHVLLRNSAPLLALIPSLVELYRKYLNYIQYAYGGNSNMQTDSGLQSCRVGGDFAWCRGWENGDGSADGVPVGPRGRGGRGGVFGEVEGGVDARDIAGADSGEWS